MSFPRWFIEDIQTRTDLVALVRHRTKLDRKGKEHVGLCPFHKEKTPSFYVYDKGGRSLFHCFGCGETGSAIDFVMKTENFGFPAAVEQLAHFAGVSVPQATPEDTAREKKRSTLHDVLEHACSAFEAALKSSENAEARAYLAERGLDDATIAAFRLGFAAPSAYGETGPLEKHLIALGHSQADLLEAGLLSERREGDGVYPFFRNRIIFPIANTGGRIVAFGGRALGDAQPKYLNSSDTPLFTKGRTLFNLHQARTHLRKEGPLIVAEGYMDVIALSRAGLKAAVAPLGTALTEDQIAMLWRYADTPLICFDGDEAGRRAAGRAAERAWTMLEPGKSLAFVFLPPGEDPDSLLAMRGVDGLRATLDAAMPLANVILDMERRVTPLDTPERRAGLKQRLQQRARDITDRRVRDQYWKLFNDYIDQMYSRGRNGHGYGQQIPAAPIKPAAAAGVRQFGESLLVTTILAYPALLDEFGERLARIDIHTPYLETLLQHGYQAATTIPGVDADGLRNHLITTGFGPHLEQLRRTCKGQEQASSLDEARKDLYEMLGNVEAHQAGMDVRTEIREAARNGAPENRLMELIENARPETEGNA